MDKQGRDSEKSRSNSVLSRKYYIYDAKSTKFPNSFQELFQHSVSNVDYCTDESKDETQESERLSVGEEMLSLARKKSEILRVGGQYQANDAKSRARWNAYPSPSVICYPRRSDSNLLFPFSVYPASTYNYFPGKSDEADLMPTEYGGIRKEKFASSQRATRPVPSLDERDKKDGNANDKYWDKGNEFTSNEAVKKRRMEQSTEDGNARNIADKSSRYWERRRRNNASAKKSRDARRVREIQTQIKVAFLEKQNMRMLAELMAVRQENVCLRRELAAQM